MVFKSIVLTSTTQQVYVGLTGEYNVKIMGIYFNTLAADTSIGTLVNVNIAEVISDNQANAFSFLHAVGGATLPHATQTIFNNPPVIQANLTGYLNFTLTQNGINGIYSAAPVAVANFGMCVLYLDCEQRDCGKIINRLE
tara:strand:+ start:490 stop:909 length:420 start_codon:yes stop_codon:yes gene_type:complete